MDKNQAEFYRQSAVKAADDLHSRKIAKAINSYDAAVLEMKRSQFREWNEARAAARDIKRAALAELPSLLRLFEEKAVQRGTKVLWAEDAAEAVQLVVSLAGKHRAKTVVKSKSMITEELELNEALERAGCRVWESDLGEFIVQLAGEKPYHIVTPAMHKSKEEISELFQEKLGTAPTENAEDLTAAARVYLRKKFCTADIGITGANFLVAEEGAVVVCENEGNARLSLSCPKVHIVIAGIEKILPRLEHLELFLPLLATSGTGQQLTCYSSIVRGPKKEREEDGPETMYVILVDNGRSSLYQRKESRVLLTCIRCGACLNACPVFRTIGGHAYGTTYQGPIGIAITPHLRSMRQWHYLSSASSLCGACTDACPVGIELHAQLLQNRATADELGFSPRIWKWGFKVWSLFYPHRKLLELVHPLVRLGDALVRPCLPRKLRNRLPSPAKKSFAVLWEERHASGK